MATRTTRLDTEYGGLGYWEYDWDDVALTLIRWRGVNNLTGASTDSPGGYAMTAHLESIADPSGVLDRRMLPGDSFTQAIPAGVSDRFVLGVDSRGRLTGVRHQFGVEALP